MSLRRRKGTGFCSAYCSLFAPRYPPRPMEMAPAVSSARPAKMTTLLPRQICSASPRGEVSTYLVFPSAERPAVNAKGTVSPSLRPMMASEMTRGSTLLLCAFSPVASSSVLPSEEAWDSTSVDDRPLLHSWYFDQGAGCFSSMGFDDVLQGLVIQLRRFVALCSIVRSRLVSQVGRWCLWGPNVGNLLGDRSFFFFIFSFEEVQGWIKGTDVSKRERKLDFRDEA